MDAKGNDEIKQWRIKTCTRTGCHVSSRNLASFSWTLCPYFLQHLIVGFYLSPGVTETGDAARVADTVMVGGTRTLARRPRTRLPPLFGGARRTGPCARAPAGAAAVPGCMPQSSTRFHLHHRATAAQGVTHADSTCSRTVAVCIPTCMSFGTPETKSVMEEGAGCACVELFLLSGGRGCGSAGRGNAGMLF